MRGRCQLLCQVGRHAAGTLSPWQGERYSWTDVSSHPGATALAAALPHAGSSPDSHETQCPGGWEGQEKDDWALLEAEATVREVTKDKPRV